MREVPPYRGPFMQPRTSTLAATNEAIAGKVIHGAFDHFGREVVLVEGDVSLESVGGRLMVRTPEQTRRMVEMRGGQLSEHAAELATIINLGGTPKAKSAASFGERIDEPLEVGFLSSTLADEGRLDERSMRNRSRRVSVLSASTPDVSL